MFRKSTFFNDCFSKPQHVPPPPGKPSPLICARGRRGLGGFFSLFFQRPGPASPCRPRQGQGESRVRDEPTLPALPLPAAARKGRATQGPPAAPAVLGSPGAGLRGPEAWPGAPCPRFLDLGTEAAASEQNTALPPPPPHPRRNQTRHYPPPPAPSSSEPDTALPAPPPVCARAPGSSARRRVVPAVREVSPVLEQCQP